MVDDDGLVEMLLDARATGKLTPRPSALRSEFNLDTAYRIANKIHCALLDDGWQHVGRKLGFTNRATWDEFELATPIWSYVYDRTLVEACSGHAEIDVSAMAQARIEPEIVLGLSSRISEDHPTNASLDDVVEWIAPGFEIVDCHYAGWQFNAADILADFGAHGMLVVGERRPVSDPMNLAERLADTAVVLSCNDEEIDCGVGRNALGGPLSALRYLIDTLANQGWATRLAGGEIITTGTLTRIPYITGGEHWQATFAGSDVADLAIAVE